MMIIKRVNKAVAAPYMALVADQEITELLAHDEIYKVDAKQIFDFMMDVLPSGTVDFLTALLLEAQKARLALLLEAKKARLIREVPPVTEEKKA